ncbi:MAG: hypothetical protein ABI579_05575 [Candidatus Sumerlaeota bacterium]
MEGRKSSAFDERPLTDKATYISRYEFAQLLGDDAADTYAIFASSGSSGKSMYWPQLKAGSRDTSARLKQFLEDGFRIHQQKTLAVVGLALGSWVGGEHFSWALKSVALESPYPFSVFSPGSRHEEIVRAICAADPFMDQFIVVVCPSAIGHLHLLAKTIGANLPLKKMRYLVVGEPMTEGMRDALQREAAVPQTDGFLYSMYGSADTGQLGVESIASVALRKIVTQSQSLRDFLQLDETVPHFFHATAEDAYLETAGNELCVTRWQGIPLMRYNLHDDVRLYDWRLLREVALQRGANDPDPMLLAILRNCPEDLPNILAVTGRADRALILCGTNLTESMFDEAIRSPRLAHALTGLYRARTITTDGRQRLELRLETKPELKATVESLDDIYRLMVEELGRVQPEFADDCQNVYRRWDDDRENRILKIDLLPWPALANDPAIKHRGVEK